MDDQGVYETEMSLWGAVLGHCNLVYHAAGWQEGGLVASFEKLVLDVEMLQMMIRFLEADRRRRSRARLRGAAAGRTGRATFGAPHTMARYEHAFYQPLVSNWQNYENWQLGGSKDATQRATDIWKRALGEYEQPALDPAVLEALDAYIARRREASRRRRALTRPARRALFRLPTVR